MTITSFYFLAFVLAGMILYYILPKSWQWIQLLLMSLVFYWLAADLVTIFYLVASALTAYGSTLWIAKERKRERPKTKAVTVIAMTAIVLNIIVWFVVKAGMLWKPLLACIPIPHRGFLLNLELVAALGMGYYTLQVVGYILDCYWGTIQPQKNPFKLFLFVSFFPQLITGPISRYSDLESLYEKHRFQYQNLARGAQRILWGFVKKLVLSERVGLLVSSITAAPETYHGYYVWIAILLYPIQMYADFSGCMDIVLGVAELFDIRLAENFRNPFFSRTSQEFWQRWHITLGAWAKDYVLYPLLKSKPMVKFGTFTRKKCGKRWGKLVATSVGMLGLWMVMGVWHGGYQYMIGVSLWYWMILMAGEFMKPVFQWAIRFLRIKTESFSWHLFQSARTYLIYAIGAVFFYMGIGPGWGMLMGAFGIWSPDQANLGLFFDESVLESGFTFIDFHIMLVCLVLLVLIGVLREKYGYARDWVAKQCVGFRWTVWISLFCFLLIFGKYGPGYDAVEFIYQGF